MLIFLLFILRVVTLKWCFKSKNGVFLTTLGWHTSALITLKWTRTLQDMIYCCQDWRFEEWLHENFQKPHYVDDICFQFWGVLRAHFLLTIWKKLSSKQTQLLLVNQQVSTASAVSKISKGMLNKKFYWDVGMFHTWRTVIKNFHFWEAV